ncbi:B12-binding domain-containing radical SAM protein [Chloroflexota bacterium]
MVKVKGKVLLIVHDVYQEDNVFPLGIGYLAAVLKREGVDVTVYCQDVFHYPNNHLAKLLQANDYDLIGVGFLSPRFKETVLPLCQVINENKKDAWLVLGGHGTSPIPEYMLRKTKADVVAIGEAEDTIVELIRCKVDRADLSGVKGIAYWQSDEVIVNQRRQPIRDLDSIPSIPWDLFPMGKYLTCSLRPGQDKADRNLAIITSRGCIGHCSFCYRMEKGIRLRSIENVVEEMKFLNSKYGVTYFDIIDELFLLKKARLFEFEDTLRKNNLKIKFLCAARVDMFDKEIAECLKRIGCQFLAVGFESVSQQVLNRMHKRTTVEQNFNLAEICTEVGLTMGLNFIWGNIYDTEESLKGIVSFLEKYNTYEQIRTLRPPTPYPGSPLYHDAIEMGLLKDAEDFFEKAKNSDLLTVNFTDIPEEEFYKLLFEANKELVIDHFEHTTGDMKEAKRLINGFYDLYFRKKYDFRGARHYGRV